MNLVAHRVVCAVMMAGLVVVVVVVVSLSSQGRPSAWCCHGDHSAKKTRLPRRAIHHFCTRAQPLGRGVTRPGDMEVFIT